MKTKHIVDGPIVTMTVCFAFLIRTSCKKRTKQEHNNSSPLLSFTKICLYFSLSGIAFVPEKRVSRPNCVGRAVKIWWGWQTFCVCRMTVSSNFSGGSACGQLPLWRGPYGVRGGRHVLCVCYCLCWKYWLLVITLRTKLISQLIRFLLCLPHPDDPVG